jgi:membrane protein YqaA with SNARE-associated domain
MISDFKFNSVMSGLSGVGGLFTLLSGIFALLFGGSLLHSLRGKASRFNAGFFSDVFP